MAQHQGRGNEDDPRVAEMYLSGMSQDEVAKAVGASQSWVGKSLKRSGVPSRKPRWDADRDREVAELYRSGLTQDEVAERVGSTQSKVGASLKRSGVEVRRIPWDAERDRKVADLYRSGLSEVDVAKAIGTSSHRVAESLRRSGVPARSRGSAGPRNIHWRGGRKREKSGYILIHSPGHPHARKGGSYVPEHRLVMERVLGRFLEPGEVVHHINGDKGDNRPENLMLFDSNAEHLSFELLERNPNRSEEYRRRSRMTWKGSDRPPTVA